MAQVQSQLFIDVIRPIDLFSVSILKRPTAKSVQMFSQCNSLKLNALAIKCIRFNYFMV